MGSIASWILLGLIAGGIARWILPGQEKGGWFSAMILGIIGAVFGGYLSRQLANFPAPEPGDWLPAPASILSATIGAIIILAVWKWFKK